MFFFSILSSNVFRVYIFNATLIINLNHISQTNTYPLNLYKMKMVRESILDIDFKKLMQMNRTRYLLIVFSEKITYILYVRYLRKTFQTMICRKWILIFHCKTILEATFYFMCYFTAVFNTFIINIRNK